MSIAESAATPQSAKRQFFLRCPNANQQTKPMNTQVANIIARKEIEELDRRLILTTQSGLPLVSKPYHHIAAQLGVDAGLVQTRLRAMLADGRIRRIGAVPNHYKIGYAANGMSVWDIADDKISELGRIVGALDYVSHCYHRPRKLPQWPYNLFAMVHGRNRVEVKDKVKCIADLMGDATHGYEILFSTRILKKTGLRIKP